MRGTIKIMVKEIDNVSVISVEGSINQEESILVNEKLSKMMKEGKKNIVFDLSKTEYICSMFLGVLVDVNNDLKEKDGSLRLAKLNKFQKRLINATNLNQIFKIFSDTKSAIASFN